MGITYIDYWGFEFCDRIVPLFPLLRKKKKNENKNIWLAITWHRPVRSQKPVFQ